MKSITLFVILISFSLAVPAQSLQGDNTYVCTPCGYSCDSATYKSPGTCSSCGMPYVKKSTVIFENISFDQVCDRLKGNKNILLLDVRSPGEFTGENSDLNSFGHLKNAININITELNSRLKEIEAHKDKEVIVYCSHSHRSPQAAYIMTSNGFSNVANVVGGVSILRQEFGNNKCVTDLFVTHK